MKMLLNESHWDMPVTETPTLDSTEIWSFVNLAGDAHPMHLHLVPVPGAGPAAIRSLRLQRGQVARLYRSRVPPEANELGWKDTVRADPGMVTRIIVKFEDLWGAMSGTAICSSTKTTR